VLFPSEITVFTFSKDPSEKPAKKAKIR
jgi:hypothetical protein